MKIYAQHITKGKRTEIESFDVAEIDDSLHRSEMLSESYFSEQKNDKLTEFNPTTKHESRRNVRKARKFIEHLELVDTERKFIIY